MLHVLGHTVLFNIWIKSAPHPFYVRLDRGLGTRFRRACPARDRLDLTVPYIMLLQGFFTDG